MSYYERVLDLLEQFRDWDDVLHLDELIRQVESIQLEARNEMLQTRQGYVDLQVQVYKISDLLSHLWREREWLARKEERELMWEHKASLLRV